MTVTFDQARLSNADRTAAFTIYAYAKGKLFSRVMEAGIEFSTVDKGKVAGFAVKSGGRRMEGKKLL